MYEKSDKYKDFVKDRLLGPNPIMLIEELLENVDLDSSSKVLDLSCGKGLSSMFLSKEYGFDTFACDLTYYDENRDFFDSVGLENVTAVNAVACLPFDYEFFDAVVCVDSYHVFGREYGFVDEYILPFVKKGGQILIVVVGLKEDIHDKIPGELLLSWDSNKLDDFHDVKYWNNLFSKSDDVEILSVEEMISNRNVWDDWIKCDNFFAKRDSRAILAGACKYLNFISIKLVKK